MQKIIYSRLYGEIDHDGDLGGLAWQLYQTGAMTRLRDVSLSSVPSRFMPHGMAASRFEHSVGVGLLARKLISWHKELSSNKKELLAAALLHDVASPPFSHISEIFLWDKFGNTHEEDVQHLLQGSLSQILEKEEIDRDLVFQAILGEGLLGSILAGSLDIDNIDNSLLLLFSIGHHKDPSYNPERLLRAMQIKDDRLFLDTDYLSEIIGWQEARKKLYAILHEEPNLSSASMLYRALEYAHSRGKLDQQFFAMGESDALLYLLRHAGEEAHKIISLALRWRQYPMIYQRVGEEDSRLKPLYDSWELRKEFTDKIARDLSIEPTDLALYVGEDRGEKTITTPFVGDNSATVSSLFADRKGPGRLAIFADKRYATGQIKIEKVLEKAIDDLPPAKGSHHIFF